MAHIVLPNNQTVGEYVLPEVARIYESGRMPSDRLLAERVDVIDAETNR